MNADKLWKQYQRMIFHLANRFSSIYDIEVTDLEDVGNEVFVRCLRSIDPTRAGFGTFFWKCLSNGMLDEVNQTLSQRQINSDWEREVNVLGHPFPSLEDRNWLAGFLLGVGEDVHEVIRILMEEDLGGVDEGWRRGVRRAIKEQLLHRTRTLPASSVNVRWSKGRVWRAFGEIKEALKGENHGTQ